MSTHPLTVPHPTKEDACATCSIGPVPRELGARKPKRGRNVLKALGKWREPAPAEITYEELPEVRLAAQLMLALYRCGHQDDAPDKPVFAAPQAPVAEQTGMLPTGVVTFMLTDVEGSTWLWEANADAMAAALRFHDELIAHLVKRRGGRLLKDKGEGDSTLSVFQRASDAVACAAELQRALTNASWPAGLDLRLRIALHSGETHERHGDYFGPVLNRAARLRALATGGVTVLSQSTTELVRDRLAPELQLVDVGRHELRGLSRPEHVFELRATAPARIGGYTLSAPGG